MHKAYRHTVGTVTLKIESVDKLQSQHVENLYDNKHNSPDLGQAHNCGGVNPVNEIPTFPCS